MRVRLRPVDDATWSAVCSADPGATFFHTPLWAQVAAAAGPRPAALGTSLGDGARAVFPLVAHGRRLASTWAGCYGGPVAERALTPAETRALHAAVARRASTPVRVVLPPGPAQAAVPERWVAARDETHVLPLAGRTFEDVLGGMTQGHRRAYRRGLREGLVIRRSADVGAYWRLYEASLARWGEAASSRYPPVVFERLAALADAHPENVEMLLAELDGAPVAGVWALRFNGHVGLWHGAAAASPHPMVSAPTTLYGELVREALDRGDRVVDFNPSGGHAGSTAFKTRLGTRPAPVLRLAITSLAARARGRLLRRR